MTGQIKIGTDTHLTGNAKLRIRGNVAGDYGEFYHDNTDFNTVFASTTDWNISGLTAVDFDVPNFAHINGSLTVNHWNAGTSYNTTSGTSNWIWQLRDGCKLRIFDSTGYLIVLTLTIWRYAIMV
jgi:hypothetical protein